MSVQTEPRDEEPQIDWERQKTAKEYARQRRIILLVEGAVGAAYLIALLWSGASVWLRSLLDVPGATFFTVGGYIVVFFVLYSIILLPLRFFGGYRAARRYGLSTQSAGGWMVDWLKSSAITLVFGLILVEILYYALAIYSSWWWLIMAAVVIAFSVVLANLAPVLLVPLFYRLTPIENKELADRLVQMSARVGAKVRGVYRIDLSSKTTAANAALMGLGNTRRVVLGDTLLDKYTFPEIETVYAHELGHHVHADITVMILAQSVTTLVGFYIASLLLPTEAAVVGIGSISDVASLPLFALTFGVLGFIWMPGVNGLSRWLENRADLYAIKSTGNARAYRNAMIRLCNQNLAELHPNKLVEFLLYDHPAIGDRIRLAEESARQER